MTRGHSSCARGNMDKDIVKEDVKSFNKITFEWIQETRDVTNNQNTDEHWNVNMKKVNDRDDPSSCNWKYSIMVHLGPKSGDRMQDVMLWWLCDSWPDITKFLECVNSKDDTEGEDCESGYVNIYCNQWSGQRTLTSSVVLSEFQQCVKRWMKIVRHNVRRVVGELHEMK